MYTSFIATIALAASVLAAPAPVEKRQGAVTCGSTVCTSYTDPWWRAHHFPRTELTVLLHSNTQHLKSPLP